MALSRLTAVSQENSRHPKCPMPSALSLFQSCPGEGGVICGLPAASAPLYIPRRWLCLETPTVPGVYPVSPSPCECVSVCSVAVFCTSVVLCAPFYQCIWSQWAGLPNVLSSIIQCFSAVILEGAPSHKASIIPTQTQLSVTPEERSPWNSRGGCGTLLYHTLF